MIAAPSMTLASISGDSERERELSCGRQDKIYGFSLVTLVTHFLKMMVVLLDFHKQRMFQGHYSESD